MAADEPGSRGALAAALTALRAGMDRVGADWMLIGGLAVVAHGVARTTRDIDVAVDAAVRPQQVVDALASVGVQPRIEDALDFAAQSGVLLLEHTVSRTPVDVSFAFINFELDALTRAKRARIGTAGLVPFAPADALVVYKVIAWRPRDREDVVELLRLHGNKLDVAAMRREIAVLLEAIERVERLAEFDALVERLL